MMEAFTAPFIGFWSAICAPPQALAAGHHAAGPALGNLLVAGAAGVVTLFSFVVALRMLIRPGERNPDHPKYRILSPDR